MELQGLQPELPGLREQGVELYVLTFGGRAENEEIFADLGLEATIVYSSGYEPLELFGVQSVPHNFFLDKRGMVAADILGWVRGSYKQEFLPIIQALLAE